jgi:hypothetical protein
MATVTSRQIRLASRPTGTPTLENFALVEEALAEPGDGEVLVNLEWAVGFGLYGSDSKPQ